MTRPTVKPKRVSTNILINADLPNKVQMYVIKQQESIKGYSMSDFINEAINEKLNEKAD